MHSFPFFPSFTSPILPRNRPRQRPFAFRRPVPLCDNGLETTGKGSGFVKGPANQTIYSYKLLQRFRWGLIGCLFQILLTGLMLTAISLLLQTPVNRLVVTLAVLPPIGLVHLLLFRFYAAISLHKPHTTADMLVSPWWGAGFRLPVSLSVYRTGEFVVLAGSLLLSAAVFVWIPVEYGLMLLGGNLILAFPRLVALIASCRHSDPCQVKYEKSGVAFLLTDG